AGLLASNSKFDKSVTAYREATALFKKLCEELPNLPNHRQMLAKCHTGLAEVFFELGRQHEAGQENLEARTILRQLATDDPKTPGYREELALSLDHRGILLDANHKSAEAEASYREAIQVYDRLVREVPEEPHYGEEMGRALTHLANLERDRKEYSNGVALLDRARPLLDAALRA